MKDLHIITIGYAKQALSEGSREEERLKLYAKEVAALHAIVFTQRSEGYAPLRSDNFFAHPTNSLVRLLAIFDAFRIGRKLVRSMNNGPWVISSQDPFETSISGRLLSLMCKIPHHVQVHGDNYGSDAWKTESLLNRLRYWFGLYILRTAQHIRVASFRIQRSLVERGVPESKIAVLPIRPELERFLEKPYVVKCEPPYMLISLGRLSPEKNVPRMLAAFAKVCEKRADVRLRIVGSGIDEKRIRYDIEKLGIKDLVTLVPWTNDVPYEMERADLFLLSSKHEAYALTLVEAMAAGVPVVTTDVGCVGELVEDGIHGRVVRESEAEPFARAVLELLDAPELRVRYSQNGRATARKLAETPPLTYARAWVTAVSRAL